MNAYDITALFLLLAALVALVSYARHDAFAGPRSRARSQARDELGMPRPPAMG